MADATVDLDQLVDLKMLPAWVSESPPAERFADHRGEDQNDRRPRDRRPPDKRRPDLTGPRRDFGRPPGKGKPSDRRDRPERGPRRDHERPRFGRHGDQRRGKHRQDEHRRPVDKPLPPIAVKFLPRAAAFESVVEQIKSGTVAYSLFALARLFLEKAPRHDVKLTAPENISLFRLGENGAISVDRHFLERNAFRFSQNDFYKADVTETEPIKGNFTNVARDRVSGTLLGPTNHHDYQRRLRNLYEQRYSRRMSFADFQRQIQIVTDPAEIEKWKEDARKVTTYSTSGEEPPLTFPSVTETERHFEKNYLPGLVRTVSEATIDGPASRHMHDRVLNKVIENEWNRETKSPSPMMQELASRFREVVLHIFRHRRGMLFVTPIYPRALTNEQTAVSSQVRTIVEAIGAQPRIGRKELADKLIGDSQKSGDGAAPAAEDIERARLALASDLLWLISSGHVIEFNDGSLDLPRAKVKPKEKDPGAAAPEKNVEAGVHATPEEAVAADVSCANELVASNAEAAATAEEKEARVEADALPTEENLTQGVTKPEEVVAAVVSTAESDKQALATSASTTTVEETEIGGS